MTITPLIPLLNYSYEDLEKFFKNSGYQSYRIKQIFEWIYVKKVQSISEMTNIPKEMRDSLMKNYTLTTLTVYEKLDSHKDKGTFKLLLKTHDSHFIEAIVMPNSNERFTLCVSSQIGCNMGCDFCATGKMGLLRDLTVEEILGQYLLASHFADISNIVFMGMGEPFLNPDFFTVLNRLTSPQYFGFKDRGITVSTSGIVEGIKKMAEYKQVGLALSYHSSILETREVLFPVLSLRHSWEELVDVILDYREKTNKRITLEYTLIKDLNDTKKEAEKLLELNEKLFFFLNIIPYNSHTLSPYKTPSKDDIKRFIGFLDEKIPYSVRRSLGDDIKAACGQLAFEKTKEHTN